MECNCLFADGGIIGRNPSADGGTWAYCLINRNTDGEDEEVASASGFISPESLGIEHVTNNVTELIAVYEGMRQLPDGWTGTIYSDSRITLGRFFEMFTWHGVPVLLRDAAIKERRRLGELKHVLLDGHPTKKQLEEGIGKRGGPVSKWNVKCDDMCGAESKAFKAAALKDEARQLLEVANNG